MNAQPHTHELKWTTRRVVRLFSEAEDRPVVVYGDQRRDWPTWAFTARGLERNRRRVIREIVRTHDRESIAAGEREQDWKHHYPQYLALAAETAERAWEASACEAEDG